MTPDLAIDLLASLLFLLFLHAVASMYLYPLWINRRQPVRQHAPTDGPWVKPERYRYRHD